MTTLDEMEKNQQQLSELLFHRWLHHDLFSWQWWVLFGLTVVPWVIWWKIVDKKRIQELLIFGFSVGMIAALLDIYGWTCYAWTYPIKFLPIPVPLIPLNFTVIPVFHMLIYQYFRTWKSFLFAEAIMAFLFAYIAEPLLIWMGVYKTISWKFIYSVPPYVGKAILGRWISEKVQRATKKN